DSIKVNKLRVQSSKTRSILPCLKEDIYFPIRKGEENKIITKINIPSKVMSPIKEGEVIGNLSIEIDNNLESFYPLISCERVQHNLYK
ncbi:MAG: hypothetical protein RSB66_02320, partial [Clostridium sp.]